MLNSIDQVAFSCVNRHFPGLGGHLSIYVQLHIVNSDRNGLARVELVEEEVFEENYFISGELTIHDLDEV